jgi:polyhydroxybutyrate depolymerase
MSSRMHWVALGFVVAGVMLACGGDETTQGAASEEQDGGAVVSIPPLPGPSIGPGPGVVTPPSGDASVADGGAGEDAGEGEPGTPTAGCGAAPATTGFTNGLTVSVGGQARSYALYVPTNYDPNKAYPVVFAFHGDGGTGAGIRATMQLEAQANEAAIMVYPDGLAKTWENDQPAASNKDIKFVTALVDAITTTYCADSTRLFAAGFSRGAYFTNQLACRSPRPFRAIATHGGGGPYGLSGEYVGGSFSCTAPGSASLVVHGANDSLGNTGAESRTFWRTANTCLTTTKAYAPSPCLAYNGCTAGKPVVSCLIPAMGHSFWSSGPAVTWSFFASF